MDAVTLQPAAGAHGEFTGMLSAKAYHKANGQERTEVVVPGSAHGTNPASAAMAGFGVVEIPSNADGCVDLEALKNAVSHTTAAFMITNPNTLGIFEDQIREVADIVHDAGALLYYDGANFNAILGMTSPGKMNFDIISPRRGRKSDSPRMTRMFRSIRRNWFTTGPHGLSCFRAITTGMAGAWTWWRCTAAGFIEKGGVFSVWAARKSGRRRRVRTR